jgi:FixJ family two-component response regulator
MSATNPARMGASGLRTSAGPYSSPTVFVVDDDESARESLESLVISAGWKIELFPSATEFLARPPLLIPACLVLDVTLPGLSGLDLQNRIAGDRAYMPIIFITGNGDIPTSVRAMKAGAIEFFTKPLDGEALLSTIGGALVRSNTLLREQAELHAVHALYAFLTPRERQVMALVIRGMLNKQVGGELGICETTVKAHRHHVMQKMRANSLADLVRMGGALRLGVGEHAADLCEKKPDTLEPTDAKRLKHLELENNRLKKLLAERDLELEVVREATAYPGMENPNVAPGPSFADPQSRPR